MATFLHLQSLGEQIKQLKVRSAAQRVAEFLLDLCPPDAEGATVALPYDKTLIAGRLGMKPESLSRAFLKLRPHGVRIDQTSAVIASVGRLREAANAEPWAGPSPAPARISRQAPPATGPRQHEGAKPPRRVA
ncbi:helix-turn-helix domain-containing protein [Paracoccus mutanolyticus]|uniref:helix-turn-helix domain-containing protein n=1 Tax=Paracoccus mutanolyticus TaxID=1499308 RepID=UPI001CB8B2F9|nr:helix-turn-helix domain-containing protein [Paracoccus mutanolyticus]